jgi:hypothetical protein
VIILGILLTLRCKGYQGRSLEGQVFPYPWNALLLAFGLKPNLRMLLNLKI